jgi:biopolymer transport protein ExbD
LQKILKDKPPNDQVVYVKSSRQVKYGTVVEVINSIRDAGFEKIGLVSEKEKTAPAPAAQ